MLTNYQSINNSINNSSSSKINSNKWCQYGKRDFLMNVFGVLIGVICVFLVVEGPSSLYNGFYNGVSHLITSISSISSDATVADYSWTGISTLTPSNNGNLVTIRGVRSGLIYNPSGSNKVRTVNEYEDDRNLFTVKYDDHRDAYAFQNKQDGCWLIKADSYFKCLTDSENDKAYWIQKTTAILSGDQSSYKRQYTRLINYDSKKNDKNKKDECFNLESCSDNQSGINKDNCDKEQSLVSFEIIVE